MLHTTELNMTHSQEPNDTDININTSWAIIPSTHHLYSKHHQVAAVSAAVNTNYPYGVMPALTMLSVATGLQQSLAERHYLFTTEIAVDVRLPSLFPYFLGVDREQDKRGYQSKSALTYDFFDD